MARKRKEVRGLSKRLKRQGTISSGGLKTQELMAQLRKLQEVLQQDQPVTRAEMLVLIQVVQDNEERLSSVEALVDGVIRMTERKKKA